jgi:hypothetical protein
MYQLTLAACLNARLADSLSMSDGKPPYEGVTPKNSEEDAFYKKAFERASAMKVKEAEISGLDLTVADEEKMSCAPSA